MLLANKFWQFPLLQYHTHCEYVNYIGNGYMEWMCQNNIKRISLNIYQTDNINWKRRIYETRSSIILKHFTNGVSGKKKYFHLSLALALALAICISAFFLLLSLMPNISFCFFLTAIYLSYQTILHISPVIHLSILWICLQSKLLCYKVQYSAGYNIACSQVVSIQSWIRCSSKNYQRRTA